MSTRTTGREAMLVSLSVVIALAQAACREDAAGAPRRAPPNDVGGAGVGGACAEGATRACHLVLGEHEGVLSCYDGVATCQNGAFGPCGGGDVSHRVARRYGSGAPGGPAPMSFSVAAPCADNPCDPSCRRFDESPPGGLFAAQDPGPGVGWQTGDIDALPDGLAGKALAAPCAGAWDCQMDHACHNPASGSCAHTKCAAGAGLAVGCDPCVNSICAAEPSCCRVPYAGACDHDPCQPGVRLLPGCDPCVATICAAMPACCTGTGQDWKPACVAAVAGLCGQTCPSPGDWTASCVAKVHDVCGAFCAADPGCAHDKCYVGEALSAACDPCVADVCAADPSCCAAAWDAACVHRVATACGEACPAVGVCAPWQPGQTDPRCAGVDVTAGVPCGGSVPVCNRGTAPAPSGIKLLRFPAGAGQYPACNPDPAAPGAGVCFTSAPIPPGECIDVTGCAGLGGGDEIVVNPDDGGAVAECACENNWSFYDAGACGPPSCATVTGQAALSPLRMLLSMDRSTSMGTSGLWEPAKSALIDFVQDPASAGLGVALRFWPDALPISCSNPSCDIARCAQPLVPLGVLTADPAPLDAHEGSLVQTLASKPVHPAGATPMFPALGGATQWAIDHKAAHPGERTAVVFITDGKPSYHCAPSDIDSVAAIAADAFLQHGVLTYVIGLDGASEAQVNQLASAGGTGQGFFIDTGDPAGVAVALAAALRQVKGDALPCSLPLPDLQRSSPGALTVHYRPPSGAAVPLARVTGPAQCGEGWYFDDPGAPASLVLCPATCATAQGTPGATLRIDAPCGGALQETTFTELYEADCPPGTAAQWGYFAYATATPGDAEVAFAARTAAAAAGPWGPPSALAVARAAPDTQLCAMGGPAPCPVDLFEALGGAPAARRAALELSVTLLPAAGGAAGPVVLGWEITYACPPSE